jgi:hypothetical protein
MADNLYELTEGAITGNRLAVHDAPLWDDGFASGRGDYGLSADGIATELLSPLANNTTNCFHLTDPAGLRIASIGNPLNYSCFAQIDDAGNTAHTISAGSVAGGAAFLAGETIGGVGYVYKLQKFETTQAEFLEFLNACFKSDPTDQIMLMLDCMTAFEDHSTFPTNTGWTFDYDPATLGYPEITRTGTNGNYAYVLAARYQKLPALIPLILALRMCNWLHNRVTNPSTTYTDDGAYDLTAVAAYPATCISFYDEQPLGFTVDPITSERIPTITRKPGAHYFIPNVDEWFKAAFYKGGSTNAGYWALINGTDTPDSAVCTADTVTDVQTLRCFDNDFNGLRFNCECNDCTGTSIKFNAPATGANICFKAFATSDCETNSVCIPIDCTPEPPTIPCAETLKDYYVTVSYSNSDGPCPGGHECNNAVFDFIVNDIVVGTADLNNDPGGGDRSASFTVPGSIEPNADGQWVIELRCALSHCHMGIAWIRMWPPGVPQTPEEAVINQCIPNDLPIILCSGSSSSSSSSSN